MWSDLDAAVNCSEATFGVHFGKTKESTIVTSGSVRVKKPQCCSDLLTNIYECIPKSLWQIFQYFLYTFPAHTNTEVRIH